MATKRGKAGDVLKGASPATARTAANGIAAAQTAASSSRTRTPNQGERERNPLIDDLFDDLSQNSSPDDVRDVGHLQNESISKHNSFSGFDPEMRRPSEATSLSFRSGAKAGQYKAAVGVISKTSQHFVHAMQMHELEEFFCPGPGESAEDALRRKLRAKNRQEVETVVQMLVELLEDVRQSRAQVAPLTGSFSLLDGIGRGRGSTSSIFSTVSTASLMRPPVHETNQLAMAYDNHGNRMINCYTVIANLGQGAYGKVKLGADASTGAKVAIKIIDKKHLKKKIGGVGNNDQDAALKREIAIMKKVRHRNCVSLYEVIDDPDSNKLYLIMDYVPNGPVVRLKAQQLGSAALESVETGIPLNGEVCNKSLLRCAVRQSATGGGSPLTDAEITSNPTVFLCKPVLQHICAVYLRQLVSGLRYMHKRHLVHHDIKPDNILLGADHQVFLTDFGVSEILSTRQEAKEASEKNGIGRTSKSPDRVSSDGSLTSDGDGEGGGGGGGGAAPRLGAGTLLFTAPELFDGGVTHGSIDPYLTDVWALGVTLYCMLVGMSPFFGNSYPQVRNNILTQTYPWCGKTIYDAPLAAEWRVVLNGLLTKDPAKRWSLVRLKSFLDQESFQEAMRQSSLRETAARARSYTGLDGDASASLSNTQRNASESLSSMPAAAAKGTVAAAKPPALGGALPPPVPARGLSTSGAVSIPVLDGPQAARNFLWDLGVSEQEVRDATRTVKVEVMRKKTVLSERSRAIVHNYVDYIRARMQGRNFIQLSCSSPFRSSSRIGSPTATPGATSKSSNASSQNVHVARVPVLAVAAKHHRTSEVCPINPSSLYYPPRRDSHGTNKHTRGGQMLSGSGSGGYSCGSGGSPGDPTGANRALECRSQSLDAFLSIVNLQSTSHEHSLSLTFTSSSASRPGSSAPRRTSAFPQGGRSPRTTNGMDTASVAPSTLSRMARSEMAETVMWPNTQRSSPIKATTGHSESAAAPRASSDEARRRTGGTKPPGGRFTQPQRRAGPAKDTVSRSGASSHQTTLVPHTRSTNSPAPTTGPYSATGTSSNEHRLTPPGGNGCANAPLNRYLPLRQGKTSSSTPRSSGPMDALYPIDELQQRLSAGKHSAVPALTSYEEVPRVLPSRQRSSASFPK